jgi:hypothetical protein
VYFVRTIDAIAQHVDVETLSRTCRHAYEAAGVEMLIEICRAVGKRGAADDHLLTLVETAAADSSSVTDDSKDVDGLVSVIQSSARGSAGHAIARLWKKDRQYIDRLLPSLEALTRDAAPAVRAAAAKPTQVLLNYDHPRALDLADSMMAALPSYAFGLLDIAQLLYQCLRRDGRRFSHYLASALQGPPDSANLAGQMWADVVDRGQIGFGLPRSVDHLASKARVGVAAWRVSEEPASVAALSPLLNDPDEEVRVVAAEALRSLPRLELDSAEQLLAAFVSSAAFVEHYEEAIRPLANELEELPPSTLRACQTAVAVVGEAFGDIRTGHAAAVQDLVRVVLRLYRSGSAVTRGRCLDLFDELSEFNVHGLHETLDDTR